MKAGVRGVTMRKDGSYQAVITFRKKRYYLGRFSSIEEAAKARKNAEIMVEEYLKTACIELVHPEENRQENGLDQ